MNKPKVVWMPEEHYADMYLPACWVVEDEFRTVTAHSWEEAMRIVALVWYGKVWSCS